MKEFAIVALIVVISVVFWLVFKGFSKLASNAAQKAGEVLKDGQKDTEQPPKEPPPVPQPKLEMSNDELREYMDSRFHHVEQLILNLHEKQEEERRKALLRTGDLVAYIQTSFADSGRQAIILLVIGVVAGSLLSNLLTEFYVHIIS